MTNDPLAAFLYVRGLVSEDAALADIKARADLARECLVKLKNDLDSVSDESSEDDIQSIFYEAGKIHFSKELRYWFRVLYQVLLRHEDGPRMGQFTKIMTPYWVQEKIDSVLENPWRPKQ